MVHATGSDLGLFCSHIDVLSPSSQHARALLPPGRNPRGVRGNLSTMGEIPALTVLCPLYKGCSLLREHRPAIPEASYVHVAGKRRDYAFLGTNLQAVGYTFCAGTGFGRCKFRSTFIIYITESEMIIVHARRRLLARQAGFDQLVLQPEGIADRRRVRSHQ